MGWFGGGGAYSAGDIWHVATYICTYVRMSVCAFLCSVQKGESLLHCTPTLSDRDFNKTLGLLSGCSFLPGTATPVSTTSEGSAVVWEVEQQGAGGQEKGGKGDKSRSVWM